MLIKPTITTSFIDNRKLCSFDIRHRALGLLNINSKMVYNQGFKRLFIELTDNKELLGKEELSLNDDNGKMIGLGISVMNKYRDNGEKPGYRLGEILRLASIIEMRENKKNHFKIYSKNSAVYFHSKYKFSPNITSFDERDAALSSIIANDTTSTSDLTELAVDIKKRLHKNNSQDAQIEINKITNVLVKTYIDRVLSLGKDVFKLHPFSKGFDMILTRKILTQNRDFYNNLFKKHGIDYIV